MKYVICCVRDRVADVYGMPYAMGSRGQAMRHFSDEINRADEQNMLYRHCDDFDLFVLGTYDDGSGSFDCGVPEQLMLGRDARSAHVVKQPELAVVKE